MPDLIKTIYMGKFSEKYEHKQQHMQPIKDEAIDNAMLKNGDFVVIFGCGTGMEFSGIKKNIGDEGHIDGIDYSQEMLNIANKKIEINNWKNITLIKSDLTKYRSKNVDCIFCTLCLSIIPDWEIVLKNMLTSLKPGGTIVFGDMQLAKGWKSIFNPISLLLSRSFGGTHKSHMNTEQIINILKDETEVFFTKLYLFDSYVTIIGKKKV